MVYMRQKQKGFTIVELLIVIVVIGILAAIVIMTYNGIQQRSRNTARVATMSTMVDSFKLAQIRTNLSALSTAIADSGDWNRACLTTGYADVNGDGKGDCMIWNGSPYVSESPALLALFKENVSLPRPGSYPPFTIKSGSDQDQKLGPSMLIADVDGVPVVMVEYFLEGLNQNCGLKPVAYPRYGSGYTRTKNASESLDYSANRTNSTECVVMLE